MIDTGASTGIINIVEGAKVADTGIYWTVRFIIFTGLIFLLVLLSSCRYDPKYHSSIENSYFVYRNRYILDHKNFQTFNDGFDNKIFDKYRVNNTIIHFYLYQDFNRYISIDEGENNNLISINWVLEVFKRIDGNVETFNVKKMLFKTSEYEKDMNEFLSHGYYYTDEQRKVEFKKTVLAR